MKSSTQEKLFIALVVAAILAILAAIIFTGKQRVDSAEYVSATVTDKAIKRQGSSRSKSRTYREDILKSDVRGIRSRLHRF